MGSKVERVNTSLPIEENIDLHITGWTVQRIGWALMVAFVVLAALGMFGNGVLSNREIAHDGTTIAYERFARRENNTKVEIRSQSSKGRITVALSEALLHGFKVEKIVPEPSVQGIENGSNVYVFSADGEGEITLYLTAQRNGSLDATIAVNDIRFAFKAFIFP